MHKVPARSIAILAAVCVWFGAGVSQPQRAIAQTADPLGLIASAAIQPFFSAGAQFTVFEIYSLGENPDMHAFIFSAACNRVFSIPFRMSAHDVTIVDTIGLGFNFNGLLALAKSTDNITASALDSPITVRGHRANLLNDTLWVIDPIGAANAEDPTRTWNPLRSAAQTVTFPDTVLTGTRWIFFCPRSHLVTDIGPGIPPLPPGAQLIRARVYDLDEEPILDVQFECNCLTEVLPNTLHPVLFKDSRLVEMVTYVSDKPLENPPSFTGYRVLNFQAGNFTEDDFGRMSQMSAATLISGTAIPLAR